ncbi:high mobility group protein 20A-like isoform X2 [Anthonomus grandis grandis]|uniref:high mobility group protein 20A-like isoform X2 n=1 Tax=Anthonomus grandis grandis TaxID=2921223 RepID=UPI002165F68F|nr:high mobility group protein 20A-like isoform X2 [Anthonomus grandis grandis]
MDPLESALQSMESDPLKNEISDNPVDLDPPVEGSKPKTPKAKKRKKPKDSTAPRQPLTGYIRYLNDRREAVRSGNPALSFAEITKILASEWSNLPVDKKQLYLDAAEQDRERYTKEYEAYKQTDAYKQFVGQQSGKKKDGKEKEEKPPSIQPTNSIPGTKDIQEMDFGNFDIPIFTEEFLDHNKIRDSELRQLRKINTDYEQQNAILTKHIENMKTAITKLETEITQQEKTNTALEQHLDHLRVSLSNCFSEVRLPGMRETASLENIENYMINLHTILLEDNSNDKKLLQTVRDIVAKMEFNG